jgi:hypothetical protein
MARNDDNASCLVPRGGRTFAWVLLLLPAVLAAAGAFAQDQPVAGGASAGGAKDSQESLSDYRIIWERNVFLSTRRAAPVRVPGTRTPQPSDPRSNWVLRGVLAQHGGYVAIFENTASGQTMLVRPGDELLGSSVSRITLDGVVLDGKDRVTVGSTMLGARPVAGVAVSTSPSGGDGGDGGGAGDAGGESVLERLMRRRAMEVAPPPPPPATEEEIPEMNGEMFIIDQPYPDAGDEGDLPEGDQPGMPADMPAEPNEPNGEN